MLSCRPVDDSELLTLTEAAGRGDRAALERLLVRYLPELRAYVRVRAGAVVRAKDSTSDIVQSVCRDVLQYSERFQHPSEAAFKRWLFTTALRKLVKRRDYYLAECRDSLREAQEASRDADLLGVYRSLATPSAHAATREEVERIEAALETLTDEHREVITLAHIAELPRAEIAEEMGRSVEAVRMLLHRAMVQLAKRLDAGSE